MHQRLVGPVYPPYYCIRSCSHFVVQRETQGSSTGMHLRIDSFVLVFQPISRVRDGTTCCARGKCPRHAERVVHSPPSCLPSEKGSFQVFIRQCRTHSSALLYYPYSKATCTNPSVVRVPLHHIPGSWCFFRVQDTQ